MERPRFGLLSSVGMAIAAAAGGFGSRPQSAVRPATPSRRPPAKRAATPPVRHGSMKAATDYLGKRSLHPGHSSSIAKLQRAFRLAGKSFTPGRG